MRTASQRTLFGLALAALCSCQTSGGHAGTTASVADDTAWHYLATKYDHNGDGTISPAEYGREEADFARLDGDGDRSLTQADFPDEHFGRDLGIADMPPEMRARLRALYDARAVVLTYFPTEPEAEGLSREALGSAFEWLDFDSNAVLDRSEFARATDECHWAGPGEAWELLLAAVDGPGDGEGALSLEEFDAYHGQLAGKDGLLRGPPSGWSAGAQAMASDGPPVGTSAPDFTLARPDGGTPVKLSAWLGRPVALIFGSYT
jgi:hypothetical protein